jgi:hypothetical protein
LTRRGAANVAISYGMVRKGEMGGPKISLKKLWGKFFKNTPKNEQFSAITDKKCQH